MSENQPEISPEMLNELKARRCLEEVQGILKKHGCVLIPTISFIGDQQKPGLVCRHIPKPEGNNSSQKETIIPNDGEAG